MQSAGVEREIVAHLDAAYNLASWLIGNGDEARDIVQEVCMRALRSRGEYRGGDLRSWVLAIVRNACFDWLRRDKRKPFDETEDGFADGETSDAADPEKILERAEDIARVRDAIAQLPTVIREAVVLREMEGMSYKEIATLTEVPIGTVMSRLSRGRRGLARILSGDGPDGATKARE